MPQPTTPETDSQQLVEKQYKDASNLNARIALHAQFSVAAQDLMSWLFAHMDLPVEARILELGCGPGTLWRDNLEKLPHGWQPTLTDLSPGMLLEARELLPAEPFRFATANAQALPFPPRHFDAVCAHFMLYHVPDRPKAFTEITRVLKPGGIFYAATLGPGHMQQVYDLADEFLQTEKVNNVHHDLVFKLENGAEQLAPYFNDIEMRIHEDHLEVTNAKMFVAYVQSMNAYTGVDFSGARAARFLIFIQNRIDEKGFIHIDKSMGVFIAQGARV